MKALIKNSNEKFDFKLTNLEEPKVTDDLVKIKVSYCGICGSDLHAYKGTYPGLKTPIVLGHEFSGIVVDIGDKVKTIKIGDKVTSETTFDTCKKCEQCKSKNYNLCSNRIGIGSQINGAMADYVISREESIHVLPENVNLLSASLTEPLACGVHAGIEKGKIKENDLICIFGPGTIGLLLAQVAKSIGAKVIMAGIEKDKYRLNLAKKIGIDFVINQSDENLDEFINTICNEGVDIAFECSGSIKALNEALKITKKRGKVIQMGVFELDENNINTQLILQKELTYIGSRSQKPSSWEIALTLLKDNKVNPLEIVSSVISLSEWKKGFENLIDSKEIKVIFDLNKQ